MKKSKNNNIILGFGYWVFEFGFSWCKGKVKSPQNWFVLGTKSYSEALCEILWRQLLCLRLSSARYASASKQRLLSKFQKFKTFKLKLMKNLVKTQLHNFKTIKNKTLLSGSLWNIVAPVAVLEAVLRPSSARHASASKYNGCWHSPFSPLLLRSWVCEVQKSK